MAISTGMAILGGSVLGGLMSSKASGDAADAQQQASANSDATQLKIANQIREDNAPFRDAGLQASNRLVYLLGLDGGSGASGIGGATLPYSQEAPDTYASGQSGNALWESILGKFNASHQAQYGIPMNRAWNADGDAANAKTQLDQQYQEALKTDPAYLAWKNKTDQAQANDPAYGSLMRKFSTADMNADPVYQNGLKFGLDQGTQGINRQAAAGGNFLSGATLKALTRFGNDYGSTKANESYNRFNNDQNSQYNKLAGLSGAGQQATNQISAAGANMANQVSQSQINAGDARASGYMGQAKAWNNAIGQGYNNWQQNQLINQNQLSQANQSSDPIYSLGSQRNWWD
jgi:hypothetical protein